MSTLKITAELSKCLPAAVKAGCWSPRAFVTAATQTLLQCKKGENNPEDMKEAAESVKEAADSISENVRKVSDKVNETADAVKEKASDILSVEAARIATEIVKKKKDANQEEEKIKR